VAPTSSTSSRSTRNSVSSTSRPSSPAPCARRWATHERWTVGRPHEVAIVGHEVLGDACPLCPGDGCLTHPQRRRCRRITDASLYTCPETAHSRFTLRRRRGAVAEAVLARARPRVNANRANARKRLARLEQQIKQFRVENRGAAAPARSVRRATVRRASTRRATARSRQHHTTAPIVEFLNKHPQSTTGDLAKSLNLDPESVSTSLNQLVIAGDIESTLTATATPTDATRRDRRQRPLRT
jgi:hypothetical protein